MSCFYVTLYETNRVYGGPEEGGWWFDTGEPLFDSHNKCFSTVEETKNYVNSQELIDYLKELNEGRLEIGSVNSDGYFQFYIDDESFPKAFPEVRPHYE